MNKCIKIIQCEGNKCDDCGCDEDVTMVKIKDGTRIEKGYLCVRCIAGMFMKISKEIASNEKEP